MPKVKWCKTKAERQEEAGEEFFRRIDAARGYSGLGIEELMDRSGMNRMTYYRRKKNPQELTVAEIQALAAAVRLLDTQEGRDALLRLVGA